MQWKDNFKLDIREVNYEDGRWIELSYDLAHWRDLVLVLLNFGILLPLDVYF
jgi:hypothetical protein